MQQHNRCACGSTDYATQEKANSVASSKNSSRKLNGGRWKAKRCPFGLGGWHTLAQSKATMRRKNPRQRARLLERDALPVSA